MMIEPLDIEQIKTAIEPENLSYLSQIEVFNTIASTNTYLLEKAKNGASSGTVCFAEEQTQGRGRCGKTWQSGIGTNINCSLLWRLADSKNISGLSIAVAVMIANVLRKYGISSGIQLKWPNDVLFAGRKMAGILLEKNHSAMVIGVGLNLYLPPQAESQWISVFDVTGTEIRRNYLAGLLVNELLAKLRIYETSGLNAFMNDWHHYDIFFNKPVSVQTPQKIFHGTMQGITDDGELILMDEQHGKMRFCYGEVSVRSRG